MNAHATFQSLEHVPRDTVRIFEVNDAATAIVPALNEYGWCVVDDAATSLEQFREFVGRLDVPIAERYGDLPASGAGEIFRTTPYPPEEDLLFHNEASHTPRVPRYLFFYCHRSADTGGYTPISDGVRALEMLDDDVADALRRHGLIYRRRFVEGLDVAWQDYFDTDDPAEVERHCGTNGLICAWSDDGVLQVDYSTLAIGMMPDGRETMFHQVALHHPAFLGEEIREYFTSYDPEGCTPRNVLLGNGEILPDDWAKEILKAQNRAGKYFKWKNGDVLAVDNRICAHGRTHFSGSRENYVIMSRLETLEDVWTASS